MKSLRVSLVLASILLLSATTVSAQTGRISCKDGSKPKIGHFSCWGHGGLVSGAVKPAAKPVAKRAPKLDTKPAVKPAKKAHAATARKSSKKRTHATLAKTKTKARPKRPAKHVEK
ncbi:MAG: hypothetical protein ACJ8AD_01070 [Gemmatimonadaceae bacterium]